ncbi:MAG: hypothetical protein IPO25_21785 [Saprospiraceae bacterium]|nr:hypothetical protein [Saprospiraceae bacterium]
MTYQQTFHPLIQVLVGQRKDKTFLVTGTVFKHDGKTPVPNVIIYYWQTDHNGYYLPKQGLNEKPNDTAIFEVG